MCSSLGLSPCSQELITLARYRPRTEAEWETGRLQSRRSEAASGQTVDRQQPTG
jgi:hypothetical protein